MKKRTATAKFLIGVLVIIALATLVSADDYHWECLHKGESLIRFHCNYDCCVVCVKDGYSRLPAYCSEQPYCSCTGGGDPDLYPPELTINSPQNGFVSSSRSVPFDLLVNEISTLYMIDSQKENYGYIKICDDCTVYKKIRALDEGFHVLTLKAVDKGGNPAYRTTSLTIDSIKPRISKTYPKSGEYINTIFTAEYDEDNLVSVTLHYKQSGSASFEGVTRYNCPKGKKQNCSFEVNGLAQGELWYYFTVTDIATSVDSKQIKVYIDTIAPEILEYNDSEYYSVKGVNLNIVVSEEVTIEYIDYSDMRPKYTKLCSKCTSFSKAKSFNDGLHNVTIRAKDYAGNTDEVSIVFMVDSKKPRIKSVEPKTNSYANGSFLVKYDEEDVQAVTLMYKESSSADYVAEVSHECPSGKNQECTITINGLEQGELWYYFIIEDRTLKDESRQVKVLIDTVKPEITINSPTSGVFDGSYPFDVSVSEKVKLEFIDHNALRPRYTSLCSSCDAYARAKYFTTGGHSLTIRASDKAGNYDEESFSFTII